ncbi:glutamate--cysteine ligase [Streptosporangiaceae bacterium NEAU-GS5]|nr:glutamate--cysteine ligase [Streptosporangiaceae bacterium NEAU-GS5]
MGDKPPVGVEEEFHVVDLVTRRLTPQADALLDRLPEAGFSKELQRAVVETNTRPAVALEDIRDELLTLRRALFDAGEPLGVGVIASGTAPLPGLAGFTLTPDDRYQYLSDTYQLLAREQLICGTQVHVEIDDRDVAVAAAQRVAPWLPVLLALSASSPYWAGTDSGYASSRALAWQRWPTAGPVGPYGSAADYDQTVADLVASGVIEDAGMIYFDVRLSSHVPTLELRVCDSCPMLDDVVLLAGLFRALVVRESAAAVAGDPPRGDPRPALLRAATWRAARSGLEGHLLGPEDGRPRPAATLVQEVLADLRPTLEALGDWDLLTDLAAAALARGSSAARQRTAAGPEAAVDLLLNETGRH